MPDLVDRIYCVDDFCPQKSGEYIQKSHAGDPRVHVLFNKQNLGVGGAVKAGYRQALEDGMDICVKVDGDGQMDPDLIPLFVEALKEEDYDYAKGNRFYNPQLLEQMPRVRLFGNAALSFLTKMSAGYWHVMDPTNGFTAIRARALCEIPLDKVENRYFFESDMLFRLNLIKARVKDIPMKAVYADEESNLRISKIVLPFARLHLNRTCKRFFYNYFLRDFNIGSLALLQGVVLLTFGTIFGGYQWWTHWATGQLTPTGTIMIAAVSVLIGVQSLFFFLNYDVLSTPK
jgi:glycosyltransferase involved in cell wall biosynthesis